MSSPIDLRCGDWRTVLADVQKCDAVVTDTPYGSRTHEGHDDGASLANRGTWRRASGGVDICRPRRAITYEGWTAADVDAFVDAWAPRCRGWFCAFSCSDLAPAWRIAFERHGLTGFQPLPCVIRGMTVRMSGDGPSSWAVYLNVARPKALHRWGTMDGAYISPQGERAHIGGKPLGLMRAIVRDYSRPGDLIVDPCAGGATTLIAAAMEGRRAIGAELDPATFAKAQARIARGHTVDLFAGTEPRNSVPEAP
jgi:site-specific DNA-methyltransferase (adenine-specific)